MTTTVTGLGIVYAPITSEPADYVHVGSFAVSVRLSGEYVGSGGWDRAIDLPTFEISDASYLDAVRRARSIVSDMAGFFRLGDSMVTVHMCIVANYR